MDMMNILYAVLVLGFVIAGSQWLMSYLDKKNKLKEAAK